MSVRFTVHVNTVKFSSTPLLAFWCSLHFWKLVCVGHSSVKSVLPFCRANLWKGLLHRGRAKRPGGREWNRIYPSVILFIILFILSTLLPCGETWSLTGSLWLINPSETSMVQVRGCRDHSCCRWPPCMSTVAHPANLDSGKQMIPVQIKRE